MVAAITTNMLAAQLRLWQLISPALPVGAYAYSQGQEYAISADWISDEASAQEWISGLARGSVTCLDLPLLKRIYLCWQDNDLSGVKEWSQLLLASRETAEILAEDKHLGQALARLLSDLEIEQASGWRFSPQVNFPAMFALAASHWQVDMESTMAGYLWAWCENQVAAAVKTIPLGQTAGQRMLCHLADQIPDCVSHAMAINDDEIGMVSPGLAIASALHEQQYSRLFRS